MSYLQYSLSKEIKAFSTSRTGGISEGMYASFNCTHYCGDNPMHVVANREKLCLDWRIHPSRLFIPRQVHDVRMEVVDEQFLTLSPTEQSARLDGVDALISPLPDCCLAISTADCVPILLYDTRARVIAAVHAGWRGTVARILTQVLNQMTLLYGTEGKNVKAVIGPSISLQAFEVGDEVYEQFFSANFPMRQIAVRQEKWHIDLWEANRLQLLEKGVPAETIHVTGICTFNNSERFFSARKLGIKSGRILSAIMRADVNVEY